MKKRIVCLCLVLCLALGYAPPSRASGGTLEADGWPESETALQDAPELTDLLPAAVRPVTGESPLVGLAGPNVTAPAAILIERETGLVLYEKEADTRRLPASVTKVMTLLLVMEALDRGSMRLDEKVSISRNAHNMGGSQVFLGEGEQYTAEELVKSVVIASGNDAAVALAEHMAGSEETFVGRMNQRAAELGMNNTFFRDCTGLSDGDHMTTARDIAIMSRELLSHPLIKNYSTIWMDSLREGTFILNNTNKLIRFYPGATGLKTGSTSQALFCLSGSAQRDGMELIAVILGASSSADRFDDARALLDFGFANYALAPAVTPEVTLTPVKVLLGKVSQVPVKADGQPQVLTEKGAAAGLTRAVTLAEDVAAPVEAGQKLGELTVKSGDRVLAVLPLVAAEPVAKMGLWDIYGHMMKRFFMA
ncbi:MAG: D-alanyl-D-alanine carboxypeptidase [Oscillospiraceae bacterium]|jgi:D-alanyl-D-alanine carboxypeptidase (penicillin-binding protein 5/6)|nr:D-alanyl-D-alanine carboxypeptidase [Oscillospiraceae bacterium]